MLCIIALGCFFLAQVQHGGGGWSANVFFACGWIGLLLYQIIEPRTKIKDSRKFKTNYEYREAMCQMWLDCKKCDRKKNSRVDCVEAGKKTVQAQRYEGRGLLPTGGCLAELPVMNYQVKTCPIYCQIL